MNLKMSTMYFRQDKYPYSNDNFVGVEIECVIPFGDYSPDQLCALLVKGLAEKHLEYNVQISSDGSVHPNPEHVGYYENTAGCFEFKLLAKESEIKDVVSKTTEVLNKLKAYTNNSCGLHVHLDMRNRNPVECYDKLKKHQSLLIKAQPDSRRINKYCKPNVGGYKKSFDSRYKVINVSAYNKYYTLEVRVHEGTIDPNDINNWIDLLLSMIDNKIVDKQVSDHCINRVVKYAGKTIKNKKAITRWKNSLGRIGHTQANRRTRR